MQFETLALTMNLSFEFTRTRRQEMIMNLIDKNRKIIVVFDNVYRMGKANLIGE